MKAGGQTRVELLVDRDPEPAPQLVRLLAVLRPHCELRAPSHGLEPPAARIATSLSAHGLPAALRDPAVPLAVWLDPRDVATGAMQQLGLGGPVREPVWLAPGVMPTPARSRQPIVVPRQAFDASAHPPIAPFVRARWRERLGFPARLTISLGFDEPSPIGDSTVPTALALASAAAVRGPWLLTALALGTPVVTDAESARAIGARADEHVLVVADGSAGAACAALGDLPLACAALSRGARRLVEAHFDLGAVARAVLDRLGVPAGGHLAPRLPIVRTRLDELGTPYAAAVARRALARCAPLVEACP